MRWCARHCFRDYRRALAVNVDGVVLVVDSQPDALEGNNYSIRNLDYNLRQHGVDPDRIPMVVQYNKRDLPGILDVEELCASAGERPAIRLEIELSGVFRVAETALVFGLADEDHHRQGEGEQVQGEDRQRRRRPRAGIRAGAQFFPRRSVPGLLRRGEARDRAQDEQGGDRSASARGARAPCSRAARIPGR